MLSLHLNSYKCIVKKCCYVKGYIISISRKNLPLKIVKGDLTLTLRDASFSLFSIV